MLVLSVFDHDLLCANDLAGICVVACKDIPRLSGAAFDDPNAPQRKILLLPLITPKTTTALKELELRDRLGDSVAGEFWKAHRKYLDKTAVTALQKNRMSITIPGMSSVPGMAGLQSGISSLPGVADLQSGIAGLSGISGLQSGIASLPGITDLRSGIAGLPGVAGLQSGISGLQSGLQSGIAGLPGVSRSKSSN